jgi:hypothetical protein
VDEISVAQVESAVRRSRQIGREKHHVARLELVVLDLLAVSELDIGQARYFKTVGFEYGLYVARAIETSAGHTTPDVGGAQERAGGLNHPDARVDGCRCGFRLDIKECWTGRDRPAEKSYGDETKKKLTN